MQEASETPEISILGAGIQGKAASQAWGMIAHAGDALLGRRARGRVLFRLAACPEPSQAIRIISLCTHPPSRESLFWSSRPLIMSDTIAKLNGPNVRFARSATRHRISKDCIRHVIVNYRVRFEESPPDTEGARARATRIVYLGDDDHGRALEVMAVAGRNDELLVIHAMELRGKYRKRHEGQR
jgi:hypothetical protein